MVADPIYIPTGWDHDAYLAKLASKWHGEDIESFTDYPREDDGEY